jgi:hypothetical protein
MTDQGNTSVEGALPQDQEENSKTPDWWAKQCRQLQYCTIVAILNATVAFESIITIAGNFLDKNMSDATDSEMTLGQALVVQPI